MSLTIVSSNIAGYTKKQVTGALLFTGYCVGNIIGPQTFKSSEAPGYHSAYIAWVVSFLLWDAVYWLIFSMLVGYTVKLTAVVALYLYMYFENKRRDRLALESGDSEDDGVEAGMLVCSNSNLWLMKDWLDIQDQTEIDNKKFRYVL